jgi:hypothetical protein
MLERAACGTRCASWRARARSGGGIIAASGRHRAAWAWPVLS